MIKPFLKTKVTIISTTYLIKRLFLIHIFDSTDYHLTFAVFQINSNHKKNSIFNQNIQSDLKF